jgi:type VI secretion system secreted protein VgrG
MGKYKQANRPLTVSTPLGPDAVLLEKFSGREVVSEPFRFRLDLLAEAPLPFDRLLGHPATVTLNAPGCPRRYAHGILGRLTQGGRVAAADGKTAFHRYRAELVPRFWLWTRKVQSRIFQHLAVPDILRIVLKGLDVAFELFDTYYPRDYCVQYRESDFAFASRLLEEEGIFYDFKHAAGGHTMVVTDQTLSHPDLPEGARSTTTRSGGAPGPRRGSRRGRRPRRSVPRR